MVPGTGGLSHATTRNRTPVIGRSLDQELGQEFNHPQVAAEPAPEMVVGIDAPL